MIFTGITTYRRNGALFGKVNCWTHGAGRRAKAYACSCNVCESYSSADWSGDIRNRIVSRCEDNNGGKKGRVLYLVDYALGGYRPVSALAYHITPGNVL